MSEAFELKQEVLARKGFRIAKQEVLVRIKWIPITKQEVLVRIKGIRITKRGNLPRSLRALDRELLPRDMSEVSWIGSR